MSQTPARRLSTAARIEALADPGSLLEIGEKARSQQPSVAHLTPADGLRTAFARIHGRECVIAVEDADALAKSDREVARAKLRRALEFGVGRSLPIVLVLDGPAGDIAAFPPSSGEMHGRMADPSHSLDLEVRRAPLIAAVLGRAVGVSRELLSDADLVVSRDDCGAPIADVIAADDVEALERVRQSLQILSSGPGEAYASGDADAATGASDASRATLADIEASLGDAGAFVGFAAGDAFRGRLTRIGGWPCVIAGGQGEITAADLHRLRRAVRLAGRAELPLLLLQDSRGYAPSACDDVAAAAQLASEYRAWRNPRIIVVCGAGHVLGSFALGGRRLDIDFAVALPWARLPCLDPASYAAASLDAVRAEDPWLAAGLGLVDDVLTPVETRSAVRRLLALFGSAETEPTASGIRRIHER